MNMQRICLEYSHPASYQSYPTRIFNFAIGEAFAVKARRTSLHLLKELSPSLCQSSWAPTMQTAAMAAMVEAETPVLLWWTQ